MSSWSDVRAGDIIQARKAPFDAWEVIGVTGDRCYIIERGDKRYTLEQPSGPVVILVSSAAALETAIAVSQVHLGGRAIGIGPEQGPYVTPVGFVHPGELRSHVLIFHGRGLETPDANFRDMVKEHADLHHPTVKATGWVEHTHDPNFASHLPGRST